MAVTLREIMDILDAAAPCGLAEAYDNPGLAVGGASSEIKGVLIAMDVTREVIGEAISLGANLIITHHPLLFARPYSITSETTLGDNILTLVKHGISAYSAHTNLDKARGGMNDVIMEILGLTPYTDLGGADSQGIGRICDVQATTLRELIERTAAKLEAKTIRYAGDLDRQITKVAVINGSGGDFIKLSRENGADAVITGDTKYHDVLDALEWGTCVIDPGHFNTEWIVFIEVMRRVEANVEAKCGSIPWWIAKTSRDAFQVYTNERIV